MEEVNCSVFTPNSSFPEDRLSPNWNSEDVVSVVLMSFCLLGIPANLTVIILKPNMEHLSPLSRALMLNLAVVDLLTLSTFPVWIFTQLHGWIIGLMACKLVTYITYVGIYCSQATVVFLSIQRYLTVAHQHNCLLRLGTRWHLVMIWMASLTFPIPLSLFRKLGCYRHKLNCHLQYSANPLEMSVVLGESILGEMCLVIVILSYVGLHRKVNQGRFFNNPQTTRLVSMIIVSVSVLCFPIYIVNMMGVVSASLKLQDLLSFCSKCWDYFSTLAVVNSCLNPVLYVLNSSKFWACGQKLLCWKRNSRHSEH